jgi:hypothetical protein
VTSRDRCGIVEVMQLRLVQSLRGKSLVRWICVIAVALASILHVDAAVAASLPASTGLSISAPQDDDRAGDHQVASERCHLCAVTAFVSVATTIVRVSGNPIVPSGRASRLVSVDQQATAPPPRA